MLAFIVGCSEPTKEEKLARAQEYFAEGKFKESAIELRNILLQEPSDLEVRAKLAEVSYFDGSLPSAVKELEYLEKANSLNDEKRLGMLAVSYYYLGRYEDSVLLLEKHKAYTEHTALPIISYLASLKVGTNEFIERAKTKKSINSEYEMLFEGITDFSEANFARSMNKVSNAVYPDYLSPIVDELKTQLHIRAGNFDEAVKEITSRLIDWPNIASIQVTAAYAFMLNQELDKASQVIRAVPQKNRNPWLDKVLAEVYMRQSEYEKALMSAEKALEKGLNSEDAFILAGSAAMKLNREEMAYDYLKKALAQDEKNALVMRMLAGLSIQLGYVEQSITLMKQADVGNAENAAFIVNASEYLSKIGKNSDAVSLVEKVHKKFPKDPSILYSLANLKLNGDATTEAQELDKLMQFKDESLQALTAKVKSLSKEKRYKEALELIETAKPTLPDSQHQQLNILSVIVLYNSKRFDAALSQLHQNEFEDSNIWHTLTTLTSYKANRLDIASKSAVWLVEQNKDTDSVLQLVQILNERMELDTESALLNYKTKSDNPELYELGLIYFYLSSGYYQKALNLANNNPSLLNDVNHRIWMAALKKLNKEDKLEAYLNELISSEEAKQNPRVFADAIAFHFQKLNNQKALELTDLAIKVFPDETGFQAANLEALLRNNLVEQAAAKISVLSSGTFPTWLTDYYSGLRYLKMGNAAKAKEFLWNSFNANTSVSTAVLLAQLHMKEAPLKGLEALEKATMNTDRPSEKQFHSLAEYALACGFFSKANQVYDLLISQYPDSHKALNNKANMLIELGKYNEAVESALKATAIYQHPAYLDTLGWAQYQAGNESEAIETLLLAISKEPVRKEAAAHLAYIYAKRGDKEKASELEKYLQE